MGRLKENCHKKNTYARICSSGYVANHEKKKSKCRKALPEFDKLFLKKFDDSLSFSFQTSSPDTHLDFDKIQVSNEDSLISKSSSNSGNDTFDKLAKGISNLQLYLGDSQKTVNIQANKSDFLEKIPNYSSHSSVSLKESSGCNISGGPLFSSPNIFPKKGAKAYVKKNKLKPKAKSVLSKAYKHAMQNNEQNKVHNCLEHIPLPTVKANKLPVLSNECKYSNTCINNIKINNEVVSSSNTLQLNRGCEQLNIICAKTSTPIVEDRNAARFITRRGKCNVNNPEFSPVECDESFNNFEISIEENSPSAFVSCTSDMKLSNLDSIENKKKFDIQFSFENDSKALCQNSVTPSFISRHMQSFERKLPKCNVNLICSDVSDKVNNHYCTNLISDCSDGFLTSSSNANSLVLPLSTQSNSKSSLCKRRNVLNNYNNDRRCKFLTRKCPSYMYMSVFSKNSMISFFGNTTASDMFKNSISFSSKEEIKSKNFQNLSSKFENDAVTSLRIKCGKGWRRSIRDSLKRQQFLCDSSIFEVGKYDLSSKINLNKTSVLLLDDAVPQTETPLDVSSRNFRKMILNLCDQSTEAPLSECFHKEMLLNCKKIGEGVYGEVFMTDCKETTLLQHRRVLKIMPIEGDFEVNGEPQKSFEEIYSEVIVSMELSKLCDFSNKNSCSSYVFVHRSWCVYGSYPTKLLELWDQYHEEKESENDRPDIFPENQLYIILEFGYGGQDLESFVFNNALQAYTTFVQVGLGLAVAEGVFEFEHRDLHWGNVLITPIADSNLDYKFKDQSYKIKTNGVKATIIDFTLSRMKLDNNVFFNDLSKDPSLFTADGDYQFQVYRLMKDANNDRWNDFVPATNIYWLHYIILKMIKDCYYKNKSTKVHKMGLEKLKEVEENILQYGSASEFVATLKELS